MDVLPLLFARRRGIGTLLGLFFRGISDGEIWAIALLVVLVLGIVGFIVYKVRATRG